MARPARLASVFVAAFMWSAVAIVLADWSGVLRAVPEASAASTMVNDDPCALRQGLAVGTDARCEVTLARRAGPPITVELVQTWESTAPAMLVQDLRLREAGAAVPLREVRTRSAATSTPGRFQRLATIPVGGADHLVYVVGNCGGLGCGQNDVVVLGWEDGQLRELLHRTIGPAAEIEPSDARLTMFDGTGRGVGRQRSERALRTFIWIGGVYAEIAYEPVPTLPPP